MIRFNYFFEGNPILPTVLIFYASYDLLLKAK